MNNEKAIRAVIKALSDRDMFEAMAEEASELSQAALKFIRAMGMDGNKNSTPVGKVKALSDLCEELYDLLSTFVALDLKLPDESKVRNYWKWERWADRVSPGWRDEDGNT